jgi:hypothetical protein
MPETPTPGRVSKPLPTLLDIAFEGRWCCVVRTPRPAGRKTDIFEVVANERGLVLAEIRWYSRWRKYALMPKAETVWEETCLRELSTWMSEATFRHHKGHA